MHLIVEACAPSMRHQEGAHAPSLMDSTIWAQMGRTWAFGCFGLGLGVLGSDLGLWACRVYSEDVPGSFVFRVHLLSYHQTFIAGLKPRAGLKQRVPTIIYRV